MARKAKQPEHLVKDAEHIFEAINGESPLACVLIGAAALEQAVVSVLLKHLVDGDTSKGLFDVGGTLRDFDGCASMAYCLGLIPKEIFKNLKIVGQIRNLFAHSLLQMDFSNPTVKKLCMELCPPVPYNSPAPNFAELKATMQNPRNRFAFSVAGMWSRIILTALGEKHRKRCEHPF
jgi:DNA-binding MltR family transcriptional regulator